MDRKKLLHAVLLNLPGFGCLWLWRLVGKTNSAEWGWFLLPAFPIGAIGWLVALVLLGHETARRARQQENLRKPFLPLLLGWLTLLPFGWILLETIAIMLG